MNPQASRALLTRPVAGAAKAAGPLCASIASFNPPCIFGHSHPKFVVVPVAGAAPNRSECRAAGVLSRRLEEGS